MNIISPLPEEYPGVLHEGSQKSHPSWLGHQMEYRLIILEPELKLYLNCNALSTPIIPQSEQWIAHVKGNYKGNNAMVSTPSELHNSDAESVAAWFTITAAMPSWIIYDTGYV